MTTEADLLYAIAEDPGSDDLRLIYADWLEENGDLKRAEFIRVELDLEKFPPAAQLARLPAADARRHRLQQRRGELLFGAHDDGRRWAGVLPEVVRDSEDEWWEFRRGFVYSAGLRLNTLADHVQSIFESVPLEHLELFIRPEDDAGALARVAACPFLRRLSEVRVDVCHEDASELLQQLLRSPHLTRLSVLNLRFDFPTAPAREEIERLFETLATSPHLASLTGLGLWRMSGVTDTALHHLAGSPYLRRLRRLDLEHVADPKAVCPVTADGVAALAGSANFAGLESLSLTGMSLGPGAARGIAQSAVLKQLKSLNLGENQIGDPGAAALAGSVNLAGVTWLHLPANGIMSQGVTALVRSPHLANLEHLSLSRNPIGDDGALALAEPGALPKLTTLWLYNCDLPDAAAAALHRRYPQVGESGAYLEDDIPF